MTDVFDESGHRPGTFGVALISDTRTDTIPEDGTMPHISRSAAAAPTRSRTAAAAPAWQQDKALLHLMAGALAGGLVLAAASAALAQDLVDSKPLAAQSDLESANPGVGSGIADSGRPAGIDTGVGADPDIGADLGVDSAGPGVDAVDGAGIGVTEDSGVGTTGDLGVTAKDPPIAGALSSESGTVIDDDESLVTTTDEGSRISDDLAESPPGRIGAGQGVGLGAETPLDADGAADTTLD